MPAEPRPLRALVVEDNDDDYMLVQHELRRGGFLPVTARAASEPTLIAELERCDWDIVLSDYSMPQFDALDALRVVRASRQADVPFVIVSGSIGEARAVSALKEGVANYVMKDHLRPHLVPVVERELRDAEIRRERREAVEALRRAVRARDEFLSIASHELKTPLTSLQLQVQSLLLAARGERQLDVRRLAGKLEAIERSSARFTDLVERLLDITRLTSGRLSLQIEDVDLGRLVEEVVGRLTELFEGVGSPVTLRLDRGVLGRWDRERLAAVITNLAANATKYGDGKEIVLAVEREGEIALLRVIDHGIGISEADQERIFERFERAVPERHYGGFGLGLWLARQIVEAHGGRVDVTSAPGAGSTFTVRLPLS